MNDHKQQQTSALLRLKDIIGHRPSGTRPIVPVSAGSWWSGVKSGKYPPSVKLGPRTTAWRLSDVIRLVETGDWRVPAGSANTSPPTQESARPVDPLITPPSTANGRRSSRSQPARV